MRVLFLLLGLLLLTFQVGFAQKSFSGDIYSAEDDTPLEFANILLHNATDSAIVKVGYSDEAGHFTISPQEDKKYFLEISYLNMNTYFSEEITLAQNANLGKIHLAVNNELKEVVVKGQQSIIQIKEGITIMNVDKSITASGQNAIDVLRMAPGVSIGLNDQINMYGKSNAIIYINGKRSKLGLQSLSSDQIQAIEIIANPSAKYDAEGNAGVINILLKKAKGEGWKGMVIAGTSFRTKSRNSLTTRVSYHKKKFSFSTTLVGLKGIWPQKNILTRIIKTNKFYSDTDIESALTQFKYNADLDYAINSRTTIGLMWQGLAEDVKQEAMSETKIFSMASTSPTQYLSSESKINTQKEYNNLNLNFQHKVSKKSSFNADINYGQFVQKESTDQPNQYYDEQRQKLDKIDFYINAPSKINILSYNLDFSNKTLGGKLDLGLKETHLSSGNTFDFFNVNSNIKKIDSLRSSQFDYSEIIQAAYFDFSRPISEKVRFSLGLRAELMNTSNKLTTLIVSQNKVSTDKKIDWFPSASIHWDASAKTSFSLAFSNRVNRPNYYKLNPFEIKVDELNGQKGNPFLKPEYAHSLDFTIQHNRKLQVKLGYAYIDQVIARMEVPIGDNRSSLTWVNLDNEQLINANISYPIAITKKIVFQTSTNVFHKWVMGSTPLDGVPINLSITGFDAKVQSRIGLPKHFALEIMGMYQSPTIWESTFNLNEFWRVDLGLRKALLQGRATLKFVATDIFHTQQLHMTSNLSGQQLDGLSYSETNAFKLYFQYLFGNPKAKSTRRRTTGIEKNKSRINKQ